MFEKEPQSEEKMSAQFVWQAPHAEAPAEQVEQSEKELSPELLVEAERIAEGKFNILMQKDFRDFAVRFMNIEEYKNLSTEIRSGRFGGREVYVPKRGFSKEVPTFSEFIKIGSEGWPERADWYTNWRFSSIDMRTYNILVSKLNELRAKGLKNGKY